MQELAFIFFLQDNDMESINENNSTILHDIVYVVYRDLR